MNIKSKILVALAGITLMAGAAAGDRGPRHDRDHAAMGSEVIHHLVKALHRLDLSEAQKVSIHEDLQGLRESMQPLVEELAETREALHEQITAENYDANAVADIANRQGNLTAEMTIIASETASGVLAQLSDEQRAELVEMADTHRLHRNVHKEMRKQRRGDRDSDAD